MGKVKHTLLKYALQLEDASGSFGYGKEIAEVQVGAIEQSTKEADRTKGRRVDQKKEASKRKEQEKRKEKEREQDPAKSTKKDSSSRAGEVPESSSKLPVEVQEPRNTIMIPASAPAMVHSKKRHAEGDAQVGGNNDASKKLKASTASGIINHRFSFPYVNKDKPFVNDQKVTSNLYHPIGVLLADFRLSLSLKRRMLIRSWLVLRRG